VKLIVEGNMLRSPSRKAVELLTIVCILLATDAASGVSQTFEPVAYRDLLKSQAQEIQSDISQMYDENASFLCDHYPGHSSAKNTVFVWASVQETHAMRSCLYQEITRIGKMDTTSMLQLTTFEFCNRSVNAAKILEPNIRGIHALAFYIKDTKNDGWVVKETSVFFNSADVYTVSSKITVRPLNHVGNHVRTFVCNSVELTQSKVGKLRQRFFSVVGNSTEVIVKSSRNGSASITLDFDVLAFNASRTGLLNASNVELLSLSYLHVCCIKLDEYGLNNETNELIDMDTTAERSMTTKTVTVKNKLRLQINVSIPVISDHSFGNYICSTYCKLQKKSSLRIPGCNQTKYFSVVFDDWRNENLQYRKTFKDCEKNMTHLAKEQNVLSEDVNVLSENVNVLSEGVYSMKKRVDNIKEYVEYTTEVVVKLATITTDWLFQMYKDSVSRETVLEVKYRILLWTINVIIGLLITTVIYV